MKNLEQIRAAGALAAAGTTSKQSVSKLPGLILANGLLAAAAFASEKKAEGSPKRPLMKAAMDAVAKHLALPVHGIDVLVGAQHSDTMVNRLSKDETNRPRPTVSDLQRATIEALAYLGYLKRFSVKKDGDDEA